MSLSPQQIAKLGGVAAVVAAAIFGVAYHGDQESKPIAAAILDAGLAGSGSNRTTDLLTAPIAPGASADVGVNLPLGARASVVVGPPFFSVGAIQHVDNPAPQDAGFAGQTWMHVTVTNNSGAARPFVGFVNFDVP